MKHGKSIEGYPDLTACEAIGRAKKKVGRPNNSESRGKSIKIRMNNEEYDMLERLSKELDTSGSEILRMGLRMQYRKFLKNFG